MSENCFKVGMIMVKHAQMNLLKRVLLALKRLLKTTLKIAKLAI